MHVRHLTLADFRSYASLEVGFGPGPTALVGHNGQGKTNVVEAVDYLSRLGSHRVAQDAPLVRAGAERAVVRAAVVKDGREALLEVEINPGRANRARVNRAPLERARDLVGLVRTVTFGPDDLALVKGDPDGRRRFLDDLAVLRTPRLAGTRAEYDRVLKQRNALLKSVQQRARSGSGRGRRGGDAPPAHGGLADTLEVWDSQLAGTGAELLAARLGLVEDLRGHLGEAYAAVAQGASREDAHLAYRSSVPLESVEPGDHEALREAFAGELRRRREEETERGVSLVGPHRDDLQLSLGRDAALLPVRGYASHGEQWSCALALRLAAYHLLRADGDDPILILDDVFAELDAGRRERLAALVTDTEQVLVTAAVGEDVPAALRGVEYVVADGEVRT